MNHFTLTVTPVDDLIDVSRQIIVHGAQAGERVTLSTRTERNGVTWTSQATYIANQQGIVDVSNTAPDIGDYTGISAMGLVWSQRPEITGAREVFNADVETPITTQITAHTASQTVTTSFIQRLAADGVIRREVRDNGLVGTLFLPQGEGPFPAVMILNGSGGGINEPRAALYASRGYAAFALAYFKAPGLSPYISNTHLEYFEQGLDWLRQTVKPKNDFVAISGQSRGGELVLLLGATFPEKINAVLAYVPSALVHSGQNAADPAIGREGPTWLLKGQALTHQWENNRTASWQPYDDGPPPHRHNLAMLTALQDKEAVERARIHVENIQSPVLLFSATDDGSWPSSVYCKMVKDKLDEVHFTHDVEWYDYQDAGHSILFPFVPTTQYTYAHPVSGRISTTGGETKVNALANEDAWMRAQAFLKNAIRTHES